MQYGNEKKVVATEEEKDARKTKDTIKGKFKIACNFKDMKSPPPAIPCLTIPSMTYTSLKITSLTLAFRT